MRVTAAFGVQKFIGLALASAGLLIALPQVAFAKDKEDFRPEAGLYVAVDGGISLPSDARYSGTQQQPIRVRASLENGGFVGGTIGYRIPKRYFKLFQPSIALETNYTRYDVQSSQSNSSLLTSAGDQKALSFILSSQTDIRWSNKQRVIPFTGTGIGFTRVTNNIPYIEDATINVRRAIVSGRDTGFTTQSNVGVRFVLSDKIDLQTRAQYQRVTGLNFDNSLPQSNGGRTANGNVRGRYETLILSAGLRYKF